jgi:hypothetical protein
VLTDLLERPAAEVAVRRYIANEATERAFPVIPYPAMVRLQREFEPAASERMRAEGFCQRQALRFLVELAGALDRCIAVPMWDVQANEPAVWVAAPVSWPPERAEATVEEHRAAIEWGVGGPFQRVIFLTLDQEH